jgi:hypothetical protein
MSNRRGETHRAIRRAFGDETTTSERLLLWLLKFAFEVAIVAVICIISNWIDGDIPPMWGIFVLIYLVEGRLAR